ncbi:MAG: hypothetical protein R3F13_14055 [Prosthecobacter sp.]
MAASKNSMSVWISYSANFLGLIIGAAGLWLTIWTINNDIKSQLSDIRQDLKVMDSRKTNHLSHEQARALVSYYLGHVGANLQKEAMTFVRDKLPQCIATKNSALASNFVHEQTDQSIERHRTQLSLFSLSDQLSLKTFLDRANPKNGDIILNTKMDVLAVFQKAIDQQISSDEAEQEALGLIRAARDESESALHAKLDSFYHGETPSWK